jgi:hypothetical protein
MDLKVRRSTDRNFSHLKEFSSHLLGGTEENYYNFKSDIMHTEIRIYYLWNSRYYFNDYHRLVMKLKLSRLLFHRIKIPLFRLYVLKYLLLYFFLDLSFKKLELLMYILFFLF